MFLLSIKRKRSLIDKSNNNGPNIDLCVTPLLYPTTHNIKNLFLFAVYGSISSCVLNLN